MIRPAENPFASRKVESLAYRFRDTDLDSVAASLSSLGGRGAVIGPHGSGKTTLMETLGAHLGGEVVRVHLDASTKNPLASVLRSLPRSIRSRHTILLDGAEQLGRFSWWRLSRRLRTAGAVVITSHRPGLLPTIHECRTDVELLTELVAELEPETATAVDLSEVFRRHEGNIRLCLMELYDVCATGELEKPKAR